MQNALKIGLLIIGDEVLSAKRQDRHLAQANSLLKPKGLSLSWVKIVGDEPVGLTETLKQSFEIGGTVFCFGGIGATPDDRTRQCAAGALGLPLARHPEAVAYIESEFGAEAYPDRIKMSEYPRGSEIIPNFYNRVPGFSIKNHHFMPGFPMMAKPMMAWVIDHYYQSYQTPPMVEKGIKLINGQESEWVDFMIQFEKRFPRLRLFSLPSILEDDSRTIDLGVEGEANLVEQGLTALIYEANKRHCNWRRLPFKGGLLADG
ncbi:MAG: competence/damage-inducible protein A [Gammaproteobacteria bacterium]|nr:competence/damage-inducible protein A [Gammaproteobacteria bacterium]